MSTYAPTAEAPVEVGGSRVGPRTVTVDASDGEVWRYFDFSRGSVVEDPGPTEWDIAFRRFQIMVNGGAGFMGEAGVLSLGEVPFDSVSEVPARGYVVSAHARDSVNSEIERWYDYSWTSHLLTPKPEVYAIRTADRRYVKLEFVGYYCEGAVAGCATFRYVYQGGGRPLWLRRRIRHWLLGAVICLGVGFSGCVPLGDGRARDDLAGWAMDTPIPKPALLLTDTQGRTFDLRAETDGFVTLLFFGYTNGPDVCPVHMANLGAVFQRLLPEVRNQIKVVFVSTDPERDTPEHLRSWLDGFDRSFIGLRGSMEEINEALAGMMLPGVAVMPSEHDGAPPLIGHPSAVLAFGRDGLARVRYPFGVRQADWAHDLPLLVDGP